MAFADTSIRTRHIAVRRKASKLTVKIKDTKIIPKYKQMLRQKMVRTLYSSGFSDLFAAYDTRSFTKYYLFSTSGIYYFNCV